VKIEEWTSPVIPIARTTVTEIAAYAAVKIQKT
jgi:hypothetical protein